MGSGDTSCEALYTHIWYFELATEYWPLHWWLSFDHHNYDAV